MEYVSEEEIEPKAEIEFIIDSTLEKQIKNAVPLTPWIKKLLAHERSLYEKGLLYNVTHEGSSALWLEAPSSLNLPEGKTCVYRPMGDTEILYLVQNKVLPTTQPYQAIIEGQVGREYAAKYLTGKKWTDTHPSTVVEFIVPVSLFLKMKEKQCKIEDGCISVGLGNKAGNCIGLFNQEMKNGSITFKIVKVKRMKK